MAFQEILRALWKQKTINLFGHEYHINMILKDIKIFSQNVCKNNFVINTILETYNIIFIQELSWSSICSIPSSMNKEGEKLVGVPNHPNWIMFSLWKDIFDHRDISCIFFFNCGLSYFLINIYSNSSQSALKYLKNTEVNINNILIMTGDFNIRNSIWDPDFPHHLLYKDILFEVANSFQLDLSKPTELFLTRYSIINRTPIQLSTLCFLGQNPQNMTIIQFILIRG